MPELDTPQQWVPIPRSPAPWLRLFEDGSFQIGKVTCAQRSAVRTALQASHVEKAAGEGQPLRVRKDGQWFHLVFQRGRWFGWHIPNPTPPVAKLVPAQLGPPPVAKLVPARQSTPPTPVPRKPAVPSAAPAPSAPGTAKRLWQPLLAPLLLVAAMLAASVLRIAFFRFDERTGLTVSTIHTLCTHALVTPRAAEFVYLAAGVLLFGFLVQANVGFRRTLVLFFWSAAFSIGFWQFLLTPMGEAMVRDLLAKVVTALADKRDPQTAWQALVAFEEAYGRLLDLRGPIGGAAGAVSGLIFFALWRRSLGFHPYSIRKAALMLGIVYIGIGWYWLWPHALKEPVPYLLFVGGALGGWCFCFPDKALDHFGNRLKDVLTEEPQPAQPD
jgi:hypothetical protein